MTIHKFTMFARDCTFSFPKGAIVLHCEIQREFPCLWVFLNEKEDKMENRRFLGINTGEIISKEMSNCLIYISTIQDSEIVTHIFEELPI